MSLTLRPATYKQGYECQPLTLDPEWHLQIFPFTSKSLFSPHSSPGGQSTTLQDSFHWH